MRGRAVWAGGIAAGLMMVGCSSGTRWQAVALAPGVQAHALAAGTPLAGGQTTIETPGGGLGPVLADLTGAPRAIHLRPDGPYARVADIVSVSTDGPRIEMVGVARGGAHANPRWSVWSGTSAEVVEDAQVFWVFGGQDAGALTAVVHAGGEPIIVGSWGGSFGLDAAIWRRTGKTWARVPSDGTALACDQRLSVTVRSAAARGRELVLAGEALHLGDGVRRQAAIWTQAERDASWRRHDLPGGTTSTVASVDCTPTGCLLVGHSDNRLAAWRYGGGTSEPVELPAIPIHDEAQPRAVHTGTREALVVSHDGRTELLIRSTAGWRTRPGPSGSVVDARGYGDRIVAVTHEPDRNAVWQLRP